jgi:hypothetical protein
VTLRLDRKQQLCDAVDDHQSADDDDKREQAKALARKLGANPEAMFFGAV